MDPNVPRSALDSSRLATKVPRFISESRRIEEANSSGVHASSPREQIPSANHELEVLFPLIGLEPSPEKLSRLRAYSTLAARENSRSPRPANEVSSEAQSIKRTLITRLISGHDTNMDVDSMIDMTNVAFESLSSFHVDFGHLYDAVKVFIYYHLHIMEANEKLKRNGCIKEMVVHNGNLCVRSREVAHALRRCNVMLAHTCTTMFILTTDTNHTQAEMRQIERQLATTHAEVLNLQRESTRLKEAYEQVKAEHEFSSRKIGESLMNEQEIIIHRDHVFTGIDEMKGKLGALYWINFDE